WDAHRLQITVQHYQLGIPATDVTIQSFYSLKGNITNAKMRSAIKQAIAKDLDQIEEILPEHYLSEYKIPTRKDAIQQLHIPEGKERLKHARRRFVYEELLLFELKMQLLKYRQQKQTNGVAQQINKEETEAFISKLPYNLTDAQNRVLKEILKD